MSAHGQAGIVAFIRRLVHQRPRTPILYPWEKPSDSGKPGASDTRHLSAVAERESDLSDELKRLTGKQPVMGVFDPWGRGPNRRCDGEWRAFITGIWLKEEGRPSDLEESLYAVGPNTEAAFCAAITRALTEAGHG